MDKNYLELLLTNLRPTSESIKKTAEYCSAYPGVAPEIATIIDETFQQSRKDKKKIFLFLIHEIILDEKMKVKSTSIEHPYIKAFGNKLKQLFTDFVSSNDDFADLEKVQTIVKRWEKEQIYHPSFLDKLKLIIKPKFELLKQQNETFNTLNQKDASVQKLLQHNVKIVHETQITGKVFNYLQDQQRVDEEALKYSSEHDKINLQDIDDELLNLMIEKGDLLSKRLIEVIQKNQSLQFELGTKVETLVDEYVKFNLNEVTKMKEIGKDSFFIKQ